MADAEGSVRRGALHSRRQGVWKGLFLYGERIAAEFNGGMAMDHGNRLCAACNSPLLPDMLMCISTGSEGIDLHRHGADIRHHLAWNPTRPEQRNGRADRVDPMIERDCQPGACRPNIGIPFLAHNDEQIQYNKLRSRAQIVEVLPGTPECAVDVNENGQSADDTETVSEIADVQGDALDDRSSMLPDNLMEYFTMDLSAAGSDA